MVENKARTLGKQSMSQTPQISVFTPSNTPPEYLEAIFTQREDLLKDAVERIDESARTANKHHLLFTGPRGCGKTHFVTLLVHRLGRLAKLKDSLQIAWLNEDETTTSLLEFLIQMFEALGRRYPSSYPSEDIEAAFDGRSREEAERLVGNKLLANRSDCTILIVKENIDALFEDFKEAGQSDLRAFLQENPYFCLVATAQQLVRELKERTKPFFGFFQIDHLERLTAEDAVSLLTKIATLKKQSQVASFLQTARGRSRIRAIHHLSGGNHRVYIVLSQFINSENVDALVDPFSKMVDELTPYYQERIRWLPALQRKIIEFLCSVKRPVPVKDIATRLFKPPATVSSQLMFLRDKGYVSDWKRGREVLYEVAEPLMRICVEVKENQNPGPIRLLVDFLRTWYDQDELSTRLSCFDNECVSRSYLEFAAKENELTGSLRKTLLVQEIRTELSALSTEATVDKVTKLAEISEELALAATEREKGNNDTAIAQFTEVLEQSNEVVIRAAALLHRGVTLGRQGDHNEAVKDYTAVIELEGAHSDQVVNALFNRGVNLGLQGNDEQAIKDYTAVIELEGAPSDLVAKALVHRGVNLGLQGNDEQAIKDYTAIIELEGAPAEQVASALYCRGLFYAGKKQKENALADLTTVLRLPKVPVEHFVKASLKSAEIHILEGNWTKAIELTRAGLEKGASERQHYFGNASSLVETLFSSTLDPGQRKSNIRQLVDIYTASRALPNLGEALIKNLGAIHRSKNPAPNADNLEQWFIAWQKASSEESGLELPLRILRAGINFLKSGAKDRALLLDLNSEERVILKQALGIEEK